MMVFSWLVVLAVIGFALTAFLRSGRRSKIAVVESLRVLLVLSAVVLLWKPETEYRPDSDQSEQVVVLIDQSVSMQTVDQGLKDQSAVSRRAIADPLIDEALWKDLTPRYQVEFATFGSEPPAENRFHVTQPATDLDLAIRETLINYPAANTLVLVSDGDSNAGSPPIESVSKLLSSRDRPLSLHTILVGAQKRLPDVELIASDLPAVGVVGKPICVAYTVGNWMPSAQSITVTLSVDQQVVKEQTLNVGSNQTLDGALDWQPPSAGQFALSAKIQPVEGETNLQNNQLGESVTVRKESLRVLLIESAPRWEFRYLRNALLRDPGVDVSSLLLHPDIATRGGGGTDYLESPPSEAAEWASYDVVFVGDVGVADPVLGRQGLSAKVCEQIAGLVRQQAAGLVLMPGPRGQHTSLTETVLGDLSPVILDPQQPDGVGSPDPSAFSLTASGRRNRLLQLSDDPSRDAPGSNAIWKSLPGFHWHAGVLRSKAGSDVLAVHEKSSNQFGRLPLLVTKAAGAGKVLFMGTDAAWRWRRGVEDKYHYRFWGQVIRWMAYGRNMAVGESMRLSFRSERPQVDEPVFFRASVMNPDKSPSDASSVKLRVVTPDGSVREISLEKSDAEWGVFTASEPFSMAGEHELTLQHPGDESTLQATLAVQGRAVEQVGRPARPDVMTSLSRIGRGEAWQVDQVDSLIEYLQSAAEPESERRFFQWWNHPAVMAAMLLGLTLFWLARKWAGVI